MHLSYKNQRVIPPPQSAPRMKEDSDKDRGATLDESISALAGHWGKNDKIKHNNNSRHS